MSRPIPFSAKQRRTIFVRRMLPALVWGLAALACAFLLGRQSSWRDFEGLALAQNHEVSPLAVGVIESVGYELFDRVEAGDVLVRFRSDDLEARFKTAGAELQRLESEAIALEMSLAEAAVSAHSGWLADLRRFRVDEQRLQIETLNLTLQLEETRIEVARLERSMVSCEDVLLAVRTAEDLALREYARLEDLSAGGEASLSLLDAAQSELLLSRRMRIEAEAARDDFGLALEQATRRFSDTQALKENADFDLKENRESHDAFLARLPISPEKDPRLAALDEAVRVQGFRIEELMVARRALSLKAPVAGRVSQLAARMGQAVLAGEPVLILTEEHAGGVLAWLPEAESNLLGQLEDVFVARASDPTRSHSVSVIRKGPAVAQMPAQLWTDPGVPQYGFPVLLSRPLDLSLVPGERLLVQVQMN